tara:strand:+ start:907 stop:1644 length:738 start_codon:yes stop_codon:yes gene_type:complete
MRHEYKIIIKSITQNFFLSCYLLIKFFLHTKIYRKKIKNNFLKKEEYKKFVNKNLKINNDWFSHNINSLDLFFKKNNIYHKKIEVLEIGSYEGNSTIFFLKYFQNIKLTCVDTFEGSNDETSDINYQKLHNNFIYENFIYNTKKYSDKIKIFKSTSQNFFKNINDKKYDLIYIDGSHFAKDVFDDAINSFNVLNKGGYIIFDDFLWDFYPSIHDCPIGGIKLFLKKNFFKIKIVSINYQIIIKKL